MIETDERSHLGDGLNRFINVLQRNPVLAGVPLSPLLTVVLAGADLPTVKLVKELYPATAPGRIVLDAMKYDNDIKMDVLQYLAEEMYYSLQAILEATTQRYATPECIGMLAKNYKSLLYVDECITFTNKQVFDLSCLRVLAESIPKCRGKLVIQCAKGTPQACAGLAHCLFQRSNLEIVEVTFPVSIVEEERSKNENGPITHHPDFCNVYGVERSPIKRIRLNIPNILSPVTTILARQLLHLDRLDHLTLDLPNGGLSDFASTLRKTLLKPENVLLTLYIKARHSSIRDAASEQLAAYFTIFDALPSSSLRMLIISRMSADHFGLCEDRLGQILEERSTALEGIVMQYSTVVRRYKGVWSNEITSKLEYYLMLDRKGRAIIREKGVTLSTFVRLLDATSIEGERLSGSTQNKNSIRYGLLRENPALWSRPFHT